MSRTGPIPDAIRAQMRGRSWTDDPRCPRFEDLALIEIEHRGFDGAIHEGELIVAAAVAGEVLAIFERILAADFPIARVQRIDRYEADDEASMADNNASCFCFRTAPSGKLSEHAFGLAIDINPVQNPMIIGDRVWPEEGTDYLDRGDLRPGMIVRPGPVVEAFDAAGWSWGGDWTAIKDYHHFQKRPDRAI